MNRRLVLVVEDDVTTCHALAMLLRAEGFDVRCAHTLADAVQAIPERAPEFVVLDLTLPDGDGAGLIDVIRRRGKAIKIAVMTGEAHRAKDEAETGPLACADTVLLKPIVVETLLQWFALHAPARPPQRPRRRPVSKAKTKTSAEQPHRPRRSAARVSA